MNKSKIRNSILKLRKKNFNKNFKINLDNFFSLLKIKCGIKNIGGYYPSSFEIDNLEVLYLLEKKKYNISLPKILQKENQFYFYSKYSTGSYFIRIFKKYRRKEILGKWSF